MDAGGHIRNAGDEVGGGEIKKSRVVKDKRTMMEHNKKCE
jgi:hypothetical protein